MYHDVGTTWLIHQLVSGSWMGPEEDEMSLRFLFPLSSSKLQALQAKAQDKKSVASCLMSLQPFRPVKNVSP